MKNVPYLFSPQAYGQRLGEEIRYGLLKLWFSSPFYRRWLNAKAPFQLNPALKEVWPGNHSLGLSILHGESPFAIPGGDTFDWLRDLHALKSHGAHVTAQTLIAEWVDKNRNWQEESWAPAAIGTRLANWVNHSEFILTDAPDYFIKGFLSFAARQAKHLNKTFNFACDGAERISALTGLILWNIAANVPEEIRLRTLKALEKEIMRQIYPDGCHVSRSPEILLKVLRNFIDIRTALKIIGAEVPLALESAIDRMTPMIRFFRHGDGGLALFNDTTEADPEFIDHILSHANAQGKPLGAAPHTGFQRLRAGRTVILKDCGRPAFIDDKHTHAGMLSFEMSYGKERLIVNCGAYRGPDLEWRRVQKATAAHSTIAIDNRNSFALKMNGHIGRRPKEVGSNREEEANNILVEAHHDGYRSRYGIIHQRRIYLAASGEDVRGEDTLIGPGGRDFILRFHLHPLVQCSIIQNGEAALLKLHSGNGWRLRVAGGLLCEEPSIYFGNLGQPRRSLQLVVQGLTKEGSTVIKWGLSHIGKY